MSGTKPPPLPPRKPSPLPGAERVLFDSPLERTGPSVASPPRLPPRKSEQLPPLIITECPNVSEDPEIATRPVTPFAVNVTPATPATPEQTALPQPIELGKKDYANGSPAGMVPSHKEEKEFLPTGSYETALKEQLESAVPYIPDSSKHTNVSIEWLAVTVVLVVLAYLRVSLLWIAIVGAFAVAWLYKITKHAEEGQGGEGVSMGGAGLQDTQQREAVLWVNHALYALFPLISTDVLTPFIDLLEDALAEQVPPMVTTVRLSAAALGSQPMLLTSLRHMTDQEWFATLSKKPKSAEKIRSQRHRRNQSSGSNLPLPSGRPRSSSAASSAPSLHRSVSASSTGSALDTEGMAEMTSNMRKRDRVLRRIPRRRRTREGAADTRDPPSTDPRDHRDPESEALKEDGDRAIGGEGGETEQDDPNSGQYVNYQVGFEYQQPKKASERRGWGLHVLAYFGVGVKGVGKTEMPVYIDMVRIKGTINLRLLLSATPPFVRSATFSFPKLPYFEISAKPLIRSAFNAMGLPGMRSYVQSSIAEVAQGFVSPESYSIDVDRLLLGRESSLRTASVGVLQIVIHGAEDLPKTDTMGSCDPYVAISYSKFNKPVFSTRTILRNRNPWWEEEAFILVTGDAIEAGERLRLRVCDSDRFSADDAMGVVEVDVADLVERGKDSSNEDLDRRRDDLQAERPGMRTSGSLHWSVKFHSLWEMAPEEVEERMLQRKRQKVGEPDNLETPWWIEYLRKWSAEVPTWAEERRQRRKDTVAWFTGEKEKDEMEASEAPSTELRSGVLQFHLHQCVDLEVESLSGTYSSRLDARKSAANGKPALADVIDRTPAENPDPPSAYCEIHLNDRLIYRTRTKQMTPLPYFNAVSERFLRDWRMAKLTVVVRDERDREHDPILGIVILPLKEVFKDRSQFTRWYPLVGGLGWGRIRISLLWKPIDMVLPPQISGFEVATLQIKSISSTDLSKQSNRPISLVLETEADKYTLNPGENTELDPWGSNGTVNEVNSPVHRRVASGQGVPETPGSSRSVITTDTDDAAELEWEINRPIRLAVEYRHSCSVIISFVARKRLKKKKTIGIALIRLSDCEDFREVQRTVPVFGTTDVGHAVKASHRYASLSSADAASAQHETRHVRARPSISSQISGPEVPLLGFVSLSFTLHPGVSRAHRKLCKKNLRFKRVYEAWEVSKDIELGLDKVALGDHVKQTKDDLIKGKRDDREGEGSDESESDLGDEDEEDDEGLSDDEEDPNTETGKFMAERRAHSQALHRRNKGIFQLKIARTGKFVKDKLAAKIYAGASGAGGKLDRRPRGADMDVEHEGTSRI